MLALLSFGESWHNNHHAFPTSAIHGIGRGQFDMSARFIRIFERLKWVRSVKVASPKQLAAKAQAQFKVRKALAKDSMRTPKNAT
jgi:stearoyl-CoA desaturase (delta-9 desaturase)